MGTFRAPAIGALLAAVLPAQDTQPTPSRADLERALRALESPDEKVVANAIARLVAGGKTAVPLVLEALRAPEEPAEDAFGVRLGGRVFGYPFLRGDPNQLLPAHLRADEGADTATPPELVESEVVESELVDASSAPTPSQPHLLEALSRLGVAATTAWVELLGMPEHAQRARGELHKLGSGVGPFLEAEHARLRPEQVDQRTNLWLAWTAIRAPLPPPLVDAAIAELKRDGEPSACPAHIVLPALFAGVSEYAIDATLALLGDPSVDVRRSAVALLALWKPDRPVVHARLVALIEDADLDLRRYGAYGAVSCARTDAQRTVTLTALRAHVQSRIPELRECALRQIGRLGAFARSETALLVDGTDDRYPYARIAALEAIRRVALPTTVPLDRIVAKTRDRSDAVAAAAMVTLAWIGEPALDALVDLVPAGRFSSFELGHAIGRIGKPAVQRLTKLLENEDEHASLTAAIGLCETLLVSDAALETVLEIAKSGPDEARHHALLSLPRSRPPLEKVLPIYARALEHEDSHDRRHAAHGLVGFGAAAAPLAKQLAELLPEAEEEEDSALLDALEAIGKLATAARPGLERYLASDAAQDATKQHLVLRAKALLATFPPGK